MIQIIVLAIVQGIAEFLPISSSGHLVVGAHLFGIQESSADINIVLHMGTLFSILLFYHKRIWRLLFEDRRAIPLLIVGTIPAVVIGLTVKMLFKDLLESLPLTGAMFPITGAILLMLAFKKEDGEVEYCDMSYRNAFLIGLAQAFALLPGISRSGSTIAAALLLGVKRKSAATFSFLLAIPTIAGASLLECKDLLEQPPENLDLLTLAIGAVVSFVVGLVSLFWLVKLVERGKLYWFAAWLIPLGLVILAICVFKPELVGLAVE